MNISNHCFQRYHERVKDKEELFTDSLKPKYTSELELLYQHSRKIFSGLIGHSARPVDVYVNNHGWVIIANDKEKLLITLYKIDLGVNDDELTKRYIEKSLEKIDELNNSIIQEELNLAEENEKNKTEIEANKQKIVEYKQAISDLENRNTALTSLIKTSESTLYSKKIELRDVVENYMVKDICKIDVNIA